jgi:amidase
MELRQGCVTADSVSGAIAIHWPDAFNPAMMLPATIRWPTEELLKAYRWPHTVHAIQRERARASEDKMSISGWTLPNDSLGAFCRDNHVTLAGSGKGVLKGLTFAIKDLFHIKGHRTGFGHPDWLTTHPPEKRTAVAVKRLLAAGANMVGRTHCDELCYSLTGENVHYGAPVNVNAPGHIPGGSSNGSAAAVAGKLVDFAIGSDCGGSVRIPASYCGILGMRPTWGRVPLDDAVPFGPSFDVAGWFARDAAIFEKVGRVLLKDRKKAGKPRRLLVARDAFALVDPGVLAALRPAVARLEAVIGKGEEIEVSPEGLATWFETFRTIQAAEVWGSVGAWVSEVKPKLGPGVKERIEWAATVTPQMLAEASARRTEIVARIEQLIGPDETLCLPTSPRAAPLLGTPVDKIEIEYRNQAMCLLCIAGLAGLPQLSLPLAHIDGLPLGLSIIGRRDTDTMLLSIASRICAAGG